MSQFIISPTASQDLEEIVDYLSDQSLDVGEQFLVEFNQKCRNLSRFPNMGRSYADLVPHLRGILIQTASIIVSATKGPAVEARD